MCRSEDATYVCRNCGRVVCGKCFNTSQWRCLDCVSKSGNWAVSSPGLPATSLLFFVAMVLIFVGVILLTVGTAWNTGSVNSGVVLIVGPFPIILGSGPYVVPLVVLSIVLLILSIIFFVLVRNRPR